MCTKYQNRIQEHYLGFDLVPRLEVFDYYQLRFTPPPPPPQYLFYIFLLFLMLWFILVICKSNILFLMTRPRHDKPVYTCLSHIFLFYQIKPKAELVIACSDTTLFSESNAIQSHVSDCKLFNIYVSTSSTSCDKLLVSPVNVEASVVQW